MIIVRWIEDDGHIMEAGFETQEKAMNAATTYSTDGKYHDVVVDGELVAIAKDGELYGKIE